MTVLSIARERRRRGFIERYCEGAGLYSEHELRVMAQDMRAHMGLDEEREPETFIVDPSWNETPLRNPEPAKRRRARLEKAREQCREDEVERLHRVREEWLSLTPIERWQRERATYSSASWARVIADDRIAKAELQRRREEKYRKRMAKALRRREHEAMARARANLKKPASSIGCKWCGKVRCVEYHAR